MSRLGRACAVERDAIAMQKRAGARSSGLSLWAIEIPAGIIVAAVLAMQTASFVALIFPGEVRQGLGMALWASLAGIIVVAVIIGARTSMPPLLAGPDTPTLAVSVAFAAAIGSAALERGYGGEGAALHVLMGLAIATLVGGFLMWLLAAFRLGQSLRFIPYAVVGGFLGATGLLVALGGVRVLLGRPLLDTVRAGVPPIEDAKRIGVALSFVALTLLARRLVRSPFSLPALAFVYCVAIAGYVWHRGDATGWYLSGGSGLAPWYPLWVANSGRVNWSLMLEMGPEIATIVIVTMISLVVKLATVESARGTSADFDRELASHGVANMLAAPLGGLMMGAHLNSTHIAQNSGARTWRVSIVAALTLLALALSGVDVVTTLPTPVLAGVLALSGYGLLADALKGPWKQRAWLELGMAAAIMATCVTQGYIVGIIAGLVASCLIFALSYSRVGVIRRHLTRAQLAGHVSRSPQHSTLLRQRGDAVHVYWLTGYIFFGSSEQVFQAVRSVVDGPLGGNIRFAIIDFSSVPGADATARASFAKLKAFCGRHRVDLVFSGLTPAMERAFQRAGILAAGEANRVFSDYNRAIEFCELKLLAITEPLSFREADATFELWLAGQLGGGIGEARALASYLDRREIEEETLLYRAGGRSDSIDLVALGTLEVAIPKPGGGQQVVRRMARETVVGEMGFFRGGVRSASVKAETPTLIYTLTRTALERLESERPALALMLHKMIIREVADRLERSNIEAAALR